MSPWESLLAAAQSGAEWAWDRIYRELAPKVRGYLVSLGAKEPDDLLGEVWLQIARNINSFTGEEAGFRSWVFMIAHHRMIDEYRRRERSPRETVHDEVRDDWAGTVESAEESALTRFEMSNVLGHMDQLTDEQREVLTLRVIADLTVDQVAEIVGKRPGAVKALQRRALRALRKRLEQGVPL